MAFAIVPVLVCLAIIIIIPVLIGVYVYRDAARRGMNAVLWTLIAVLAPTLIGFIIYLLVRGNYPDLKCPTCAAPVTQEYVVCPKCGAKLRSSCANCGNPTEPDWAVCPRCASPLPEVNDDYEPPIRKKDTTLVKILVLVILIPLLLLVLLGVFSFSSFGGVGSMGTTQFSAYDYRDHAEISAWINKCNENPSKTYALRYKAEYGEQKATYYLVYRPSLTKSETFSAGNSSGLFGSNVEVRYFESPGASVEDNKLAFIVNYSARFAGLKVYVDGNRTDCEITEVNFNPAQFELFELESGET